MHVSMHANRDMLGNYTDVFTCEKFSVHTHSCINDILRPRMQVSPAKSGHFWEGRVVLAKRYILHVFKVDLKIGFRLELGLVLSCGGKG